MANRITEMTAGGALQGTELLEMSQRSASVTISGTTLSAAAADNSINDSADGFTGAGFVTGDRVTVSGFTEGANNIFAGVLESVAAGKLVIAAPEGDAIVDEAAGDTVTVTKWVTRRTTAQEVADLGGGDVAIEDDDTPVIAAASTLNFTGPGVTVTDAGSGQADIAITGGGGGGGGGGSTMQTAAFSHSVAANVAGGAATTGAFTTRVLNTQDANSISGASLASNQITLPAGTYRVSGFQEFYRTQITKTRLHNVTDDVALVQGSTLFTNEADSGAPSSMQGVFTLTAAKVLEFQYEAQGSFNTNALGVLDPNDPATFAKIVFEKIDDFGGGSGAIPDVAVVKAWAEVDGVGGATVSASGNVASVVRNGDGDYTINFTTAMADTNYHVVLSGRFPDDTLNLSNVPSLNVRRSAGAKATGSIRIQAMAAYSTAVDCEFNIAILVRETVGGLGSSFIEAGAAVNLLSANIARLQRFTTVGAKTLTVQPDATEAIPQDAEFYGANRAASGNLTIVAGSGVTINVPAGGSLVINPGGTYTLKRVAVDEFDLMGQTA